MTEIIVKSEMQDDGEILLFYVDENGGNEEGVITTVENIENAAVQLQQDNSYMIENVSDYPGVSLAQSNQSEEWTDSDIQRLLVFYNDNKQTFKSGTTKKEHLWTVACKTMLIGKTPTACETQLENLQAKWVKERYNINWPYLDLCHQAFSEDNNTAAPEYEIQIGSNTLEANNHQNYVVVQKALTTESRPNVDENVISMLELYLKCKKNFDKEYWRRGLWETIALELGTENGEYWQKRFLNYKHHYLRLLDKKSESGREAIHWPYFDLFDQIFKDDYNFQKKIGNQNQLVKPVVEVKNVPVVYEWDNTEKTVLAKYCYDCFEDFCDPTIPDTILWTEVGRLLDRSAELCKKKFEELKIEHLDKYIQGIYNMRSRIPLEILFDAIITKEIELEFAKNSLQSESLELWKSEELDEVVQFIYDNIELYKDSGSHFVCWAAIARKLKRKVDICRSQWEDLVMVYKTILNDNKENPDMQIDWRYIELFDRIFDYGMDTNLLGGYEKTVAGEKDKKITVRKVNIKMETDQEKDSEDESTYDERGFPINKKQPPGDSKAWKILEFYQKNKDRFATSNKNKHALWEILAEQIGISAAQCAHRFRNLKQVYTTYIQREINKPEMPIVWPYYAQCKKVFGYRAIKNKLKNSKANMADTGDWSAKEIKLLINYFSKNFNEINNEEAHVWAELSKAMGRSETACRDKFLELRKSYRKLRTMRTRNPETKISWKYYNIFEQIYSKEEERMMEVDELDDSFEFDEVPNEQEEDDYQCIIVLPEGQDISDIDSSQVIIQNPKQTQSEYKPPKKWTKRTKKLLIIHYINYIRTHKGREINKKNMWSEIAAKLPGKTAVGCRKMLAKIKANYTSIQDEEKKNHINHRLLEIILRLKPKFTKSDQNKQLKDEKVYKDVVLPDEKVEQALQYYLKYIEDFVSPRFEKKYLWTELANAVSEPVTKVFNKINYLKQAYNTDNAVVTTPYDELLREIIAKEIVVKLIIENDPKPVVEESGIEETWSDEETVSLLEWYLSNLDKFKNPKYVRSYLWMEVSNILGKSAIACSKKMSEIRTQYRNMVREGSEQLSAWRFLDLCQKIYGTGKKDSSNGS